MRHMKKIVSLLLAAVTVVCLAVAVSSAAEGVGTYTITAPDNGLTYEIYQLFTGTVKEDGTLSNLLWGQNGTDTEGGAVDQSTLNNLESVALSASDPEKLAVVTSYVDLESTPFQTLSDGQSVQVPGGYYLIKDSRNVQGSGESPVTLYLVQVAKDMTITPKISTAPRLEKNVRDTNDSTGKTGEWQSSADYDIGDSVPFQLKATLSDTLSMYNIYQVTFHDTLSAGLTCNQDVVVQINGEDVTSGFEITYGDGTLTAVCGNIKNLVDGNDAVITLEYTATLNENAVIGAGGNSGEAYLEFSSNPNDGQSGGTGETPKDKAVVFTYQAVVNKVDSNGDPLAGAKFKLDKLLKDGSWEAVAAVENDDGTTFTFSGLDDGNYRLTETQAPASYNPIAPVHFTITAAHDADSADPKLTSLTGSERQDETFTGNHENGLVFHGNTDDGSLTANVVNKLGLLLPSTGGAGTTVFYALGSVLALGAAVLLITRKRMSGR